MPLTTQILVSTFKVVGGGGWGVGRGMPPNPLRKFLFFFSLAIPGSDVGLCPLAPRRCRCFAVCLPSQGSTHTLPLHRVGDSNSV